MIIYNSANKKNNNNKYFDWETHDKPSFIAAIPSIPLWAFCGIARAHTNLAATTTVAVTRTRVLAARGARHYHKLKLACGRESDVVGRVGGQQGVVQPNLKVVVWPPALAGAVLVGRDAQLRLLGALGELFLAHKADDEGVELRRRVEVVVYRGVWIGPSLEARTWL